MTSPEATFNILNLSGLILSVHISWWVKLTGGGGWRWLDDNRTERRTKVYFSIWTVPIQLILPSLSHTTTILDSRSPSVKKDDYSGLDATKLGRLIFLMKEVFVVCHPCAYLSFPGMFKTKPCLSNYMPQGWWVNPCQVLAFAPLQLTFYCIYTMCMNGWMSGLVQYVVVAVSGWAPCGIPSTRLSHDPDVRRRRGSPRLERAMNISLGLARSIPFHCIDIHSSYLQSPQNQGRLPPPPICFFMPVLVKLPHPFHHRLYIGTDSYCW